MFRGLAKFCQLFIDAIVAVGNIISYLFPASPFTFAANSHLMNLFQGLITLSRFMSLSLWPSSGLWLLACIMSYLFRRDGRSR